MISHLGGVHQRGQPNSGDFGSGITHHHHSNNYSCGTLGQHHHLPPFSSPPIPINVATNNLNQKAPNMNHQQHHWYQQQQPTYNYVAPSNSREMRNKAEKQRRDRLNSFIGELALLVPQVSKSPKRMDKTSILRLTANHLRIYQTLVKSEGLPSMELPKQVDQFVLEQLICEDMGAFLLIISPNGKIIFVSPTVETLLGHLQSDLMGQSLFTITANEDQDRLRIYLMNEGDMEEGWRKYFNIRIRRAGPKSETPVYETVKMMGVHRNLSPRHPSNSAASSPASTSSIQTSLNTDILVFLVKMSSSDSLVNRLFAVSKDEYVTRHLIDGRIIGCDQRISLIAGYMTDEVQGHSAFMYMHREDVRWVLIALRQMYDKGESRGNSCYRLKSRNGQFIYLKTFGFLEIDDQGTVESFVCVNILVDEKEGKMHINDMKRRYGAMFTSSLAELPYNEDISFSSGYSKCEPFNEPPVPIIPDRTPDSTEDPETVQQAVNELMQNLPSPGSEEAAVSSTHEQQPSHTAISTPYQEPVSMASKTTLIRIKSTGKRAPSVSPDPVKRQRVSSIDSETTINTSSTLTYPKVPPSIKLEEQYQIVQQDIKRYQQHKHYES